MRLVVALVAVAALTAGCNSICDPLDAFGAGPDCSPPEAAIQAAANEGSCGQPPAIAAPGEVWCCVPVEVPGAAPERICVQEECARRIEIPATYESVTEQVLIAPGIPGRTEWRRIECETAGESECWALVEIAATPPVYEARSREVLKSPATYSLERIPARYEEVPAAPNMVWQWRRFDNCEVPANARAVHTVPPAGTGVPPGFDNIK